MRTGPHTNWGGLGPATEVMALAASVPKAVFSGPEAGLFVKPGIQSGAEYLTHKSHSVHRPHPQTQVPASSIDLASWPGHRPQRVVPLVSRTLPRRRLAGAMDCPRSIPPTLMSSRLTLSPVGIPMLPGKSYRATSHRTATSSSDLQELSCVIPARRRLLGS